MPAGHREGIVRPAVLDQRPNDHVVFGNDDRTGPAHMVGAGGGEADVGRVDLPEEGVVRVVQNLQARFRSGFVWSDHRDPLHHVDARPSDHEGVCPGNRSDHLGGAGAELYDDAIRRDGLDLKLSRRRRHRVEDHPLYALAVLRGVGVVDLVDAEGQAVRPRLLDVENGLRTCCSATSAG